VVRVRVREGRVQVVAGPDTLILRGGEQAQYDRVGRQLERSVNGPLEHWGDKLLQFEQAPLPMVVAELQRRYGVEVELGNAPIAACRLTATFDDETVETVLQVIADTFGLRVVHLAPGRFRLEGNGC
jgi:ferric-dicitrate binding protein FerR (iron transport regulator)